MTTTPSLLAVAASGFYLLVLLACTAAAIVAGQNRQQPSHTRWWLLLAVFFAVLIVLRMLAVEELVRDHIRDTLRASGSYRERRSIQGPIVVSILFIAAGAGSVLLYRWGRSLRGRRNVMVFAAILASLAMSFLIVLRLTSLHAIDALLYGALKLNWVVDLGSSLVVLLAALGYIRLVRARP